MCAEGKIIRWRDEFSDCRSTKPMQHVFTSHSRCKHFFYRGPETLKLLYYITELGRVKQYIVSITACAHLFSTLASGYPETSHLHLPSLHKRGVNFFLIYISSYVSASFEMRAVEEWQVMILMFGRNFKLGSQISPYRKGGGFDSSIRRKGSFPEYSSLRKCRLAQSDVRQSLNLVLISI